MRTGKSDAASRRNSVASVLNSRRCAIISSRYFAASCSTCSARPSAIFTLRALLRTRRLVGCYVLSVRDDVLQLPRLGLENLTESLALKPALRHKAKRCLTLCLRLALKPLLNLLFETTLGQPELVLKRGANLSEIIFPCNRSALASYTKSCPSARRCAPTSSDRDYSTSRCTPPSCAIHASSLASTRRRNSVSSPRSVCDSPLSDAMLAGTSSCPLDDGCCFEIGPTSSSSFFSLTRARRGSLLLHVGCACASSSRVRADGASARAQRRPSTRPKEH